MSAPTLDRPLTTPSPAPQPGHGGVNDDDGMAHKFRHDDIDKSLATGVPVVALCGYRQKLTRPNQAGRPPCPKCMELAELAESLEP